MNFISAPFPSAKHPRLQRGHTDYRLLLMSLGLVGALGASGWYGIKLFATPAQLPQRRAEITPRPLPAGSSVMGLTPTVAAPASAAKAPAAPAKPEQPGVTLQTIAKAEAVRQGQPPGQLYENSDKPMAMHFDRVTLDAPEVSEAQALFEAFLKASSNKDRRLMVFHPERTEERMREYYEKRGGHDLDPGPLLAAGYLIAGKSRVLNLQFACPSRPDAGLRANFHQTRGGKLLLDWESLNAWCEVDWSDFKKQRSPREVVMRAIASESSYYNYEFSDHWNWLAVKLRSADGQHSVTGYVQRNSALGIAMANLIGVPLPHKLPDDTPLPAIKPPGSKSLVTLRLRYPIHAQSDGCVQIANLLADRWLLFPSEED